MWVGGGKKHDMWSVACDSDSSKQRVQTPFPSHPPFSSLDWVAGWFLPTNTGTACLLCVYIVINYLQPLQPHFQAEVIRNSSLFWGGVLFVCLLFFKIFLLSFQLETLEHQVRTQIQSLFSGFATDSLALSGTGCTDEMWSSINLCPWKSFFIKTENYLTCVSASPSSPLVMALCSRAESLKRSKRGVCTEKSKKNWDVDGSHRGHCVWSKKE